MKNFDIEARRKELKLTLEQIGDFVGVSKSTVKKWESGYIDNMKRDKIALLAQVLKVSPLEIIGINPEEHKEKNPVSFFENKYNKHHQKVIDAYIAKPEMQPAVDKLLGVESEDNTTPLDTLKQKTFIAAASGKKIDAEPLDIDTMIEIENMDKLN